MLYFTGSGEFNKNIRTFAIKCGYKLNEYGIFHIRQIKKLTTGFRGLKQIVKDIFGILNLDYIEPKNRLATIESLNNKHLKMKLIFYMELLREVNRLYNKHGSGDYIGEKISQREQVQAALAEKHFKVKMRIVMT